MSKRSKRQRHHAWRKAGGASQYIRRLTPVDLGNGLIMFYEERAKSPPAAPPDPVP